MSTGGEVCDSPVPGAITWLRTLLEDKMRNAPDALDIVIISEYIQRYSLWENDALVAWLVQNGIDEELLHNVRFHKNKYSHTFASLSDKNITFTGRFPSKEELLSFKPWYIKR
jgi:hypothetical protein